MRVANKCTVIYNIYYGEINLLKNPIYLEEFLDMPCTCLVKCMGYLEDRKPSCFNLESNKGTIIFCLKIPLLRNSVVFGIKS